MFSWARVEIVLLGSDVPARQSNWTRESRFNLASTQELGQPLLTI